MPTPHETELHVAMLALPLCTADRIRERVAVPKAERF
jgi:hypothetical protein